MSRLSRQLLKVIEWKDETMDTMAYRYPMSDRAEIMNGCQLIVKPSQVAVLVSSGKIADIFEPGRFKLSTGNIPILTKLMGWKYGFDSPFKCEVYYVNTKQFIDQKWGTTNPVMMRDADYGVVRFRANGIFSFKVGDPAMFLTELFGTQGMFKSGFVSDQLRKIIASMISEAVNASKIPAADLAGSYSKLTETVMEVCAPKFEKIGMKVSDITLNNITLDEESEKAISLRAKMNIIGNVDEYKQYAAADAMTEISKNAHLSQGGNLMGMGMGMGTAFNMAGMYAGSMNPNFKNDQKEQGAPKGAESPISKCPSCGAANNKTQKFCCQCGVRLQRECPKCRATLTAGQKFCPECGTNVLEQEKPQPPKNICPNCKLECREGARFCPACGQKLQ